MIKNKKIKEFCVAATLSGALMVSLHTTAYAVITDYTIKVNEQIFSYNQNELEKSFLSYKSGEKSRLYEDFRSKLNEGNGFYAFKDDKKGFIPYKTVEKGFLESKYNSKSFNIDEFIESDTCKSVEVQSVNKVNIDEKNEIIIKENISTENKEIKKQEESTSTSSTSSSSSRRIRSSSSSKRNKVIEVKKEEKIVQVEKAEQEKQAQIQRESEVKINQQKEEQKLVAKSDVLIKSEITQTAQKSRRGNYQVTTVMIEGTVQANGVFQVAGERVEVQKGDDYSRVADKIYNKFKNNENWLVEFKYVQAGYKANITFTSKKIREHVNSLVVSGNGIKFKYKNEEHGTLPIAEKAEICTVTVLDTSKSNNTLKIKVSSNVINKTFATLSAKLESGDSKETIAEKISNALRSNANITRYFIVKNHGSQIVLTERIADKLNLKVELI
ncbi:hypothetical protein G8S49_03630 [Clostridium botulinum C]|uniref:Uncharacterized protein n=2 Tax=Clostridium botulinum TaxID=1491 RepID=A0A9Q4TGJ4_CLOBO|nr:hypothetical protein [Clostridium botulinum]MCD3193719.1 hypothetical protein [Clostridium botulinum C]MCD3199787.1 hypothetical protein [Clostridium botulinum C]MCD3205262.1 hypothetical protein [Clostridium botulinum C]MCD3207188.1 hypothetical protein [Clostridium botulinum C]MCD3224590.1 hypothetical protein [Clostridium botulinum C]